MFCLFEISCVFLFHVRCKLNITICKLVAMLMLNVLETVTEIVFCTIVGMACFDLNDHWRNCGMCQWTSIAAHLSIFPLLTSGPPRCTFLRFSRIPSTRGAADTAASRASAGRATALPSEHLDDALQTVELLGLGVQPRTSDHSKEDGLGEAVAGSPEGRERSGDRSRERFAKGMEALLKRGSGPDSSWRCEKPEQGISPAGGRGVGGGDVGWRCFAGRMGREEAEALLRCVWYRVCFSWVVGLFACSLSMTGVRCER